MHSNLSLRLFQRILYHPILIFMLQLPKLSIIFPLPRKLRRTSKHKHEIVPYLVPIKKVHLLLKLLYQLISRCFVFVERALLCVYLQLQVLQFFFKVISGFEVILGYWG